ncbi:hypothetical protein DSLASN_09210 [Desulfoluna limicola]|uniref:Solute-binding protein family 3/N-terminal domain-containing protein n=1 Tax=Desulfoluna limicola TaxID=2810562 RepID=A0ABM7PDR2_9BACT|nr:transporter substrate-binding domain-containing protein [Desulfoluna limicola]BCS95289.1 hypothetical protein DSLASN_09210 [Desulfoluna limicola]
MSIRHTCVLFFLLVSGGAFPQTPLHASETVASLSVSLTDDESAWIKSHPVIRVSNEPGYAPFDFTEKGKPAGLSIDYLNMVARRAGLRLEYVQDTWGNLLEMGKQKKIDLLHTMFYAPEREAYFLFTEPYKSLINGIYVREGVTGVRSIDDLANKRVILTKGDTIGELLTRLVPDAEYVFVDTYDAIVKAIALGQGDATVMDTAVANYLIRKFTLTNILPAGEAKFATGQRDPRYYIAVRKDWPMLHAILQKSMNTITRDDMARLEFRWFGLSSPPENVGIRLTEKERAFLDTHPRIRVHNEKDWSPFNYHEYGSPRGLSIDYMNLVANRLGVLVTYVTGPSWDEFLGMIKGKELDVMLNIVKTDDRAAYIRFTEPYARAPNVIVSADSHPYESMAELEGRVVAFPKGFFYEEVLTSSFPQIRRLPLPDTLACLKAVSLGKADAVLSEGVVINSLIHRNMLTGLRITGEARMGHPDFANLRLGIREDWPLLHSAVMKAMADISPQEMRRIREKWLQSHKAAELPEPSVSVVYKPLVAYGAGAFALMALVAWGWGRRVKKESAPVQFGSPVFRGLLLAGLSVFVITVGFIGWVTLEDNKKQHLQGVERDLKGVLSIFEDRLDLWLSEKVSFLRQMGRDPMLAAMTRALFVESSGKDDLLAADVLSDELRDMRSYFEAQKTSFHHIDFFIINSNHTVIGAMRDADIGTRHLISRQGPELLERALRGEVFFVPPMAPAPRPGLSGLPYTPETSLAMFFVGPIRDMDGRILAVMALRVTPWNEFEEATRLLDELKTGETYAFDREGRMLSPSRFEDQLRSIGLLEQDRGSALNIEIRDPGVNLTKGERPHQDRLRQPLVQMVIRAVQLRTEMKLAGSLQGHSETEVDISGYRDYRGVPVLGAWLWNMDLDFGLVAEVDVEEAMSTYHQSRLMIAGVLGGTLIFALSAVLLVLLLGERSCKALICARDSLEEEVAELKTEANDLLKQAGLSEKYHTE